MSARRVIAVLAGTAAAILAAGAAPSLTARAASAGPDAQAWWYAGNVGNGTPTPPAPPGVAATDIVVQGAKGDQTLPSSSLVPGAPSPPATPFTSLGNQGGATAIAALRFTVPAGAAIARLTLHYDGSPPPSGPQVAACKIPGGTFVVEQEGPFADVPSYDCTTPSIGSVGPDGSSLVFSDIGALASGQTLAVALVPIYPDQEAFAHPGSDALTFRSAPPAFDAGSSPSGPTIGAGGPAAASGGFPSADGGIGGGAPFSAAAPGSLPPALGAAVPTAGTPGPQATPGATGPSAPARASSAVAVAAAPNDTSARVAAVLALVAAAAGFAFLLFDRPRLRLLLGGRPSMTPFNRSQQTTGGLGRFARPRTGQPPAL